MEKPDYDVGNKAVAIEKILKDENLATHEVLFVGNDSNDESVKQTGVTTVCINPRKTDITNKEFWDYGIEKCDNLQEVLHFIKFYKKSTTL